MLTKPCSQNRRLKTISPKPARLMLGASLLLLSFAGPLFVSPAFAEIPSTLTSRAPEKDSSLKQIAASNKHFRYEGRFDRSKPEQVVAIWQSTRISADFKSKSLRLEFGPAENQSYFDVQVDADTEVIGVKAGPAAQEIVWPKPLDTSLHHLTIIKRSEAAAGHATFNGIAIDREGRIASPVTQPHRLKLEFFGDSITAGACNEDGDADQWTDYRTHNANKSYAAFTAHALDADWQNIAISGMGIITGYVKVHAGEVWDKTYPSADSARADLADWTPDIAFVNYGENDTSFTHGHGQPFPTNFTDGYVALIQAIRKAYPKAEIVLLRGGMGGGAEDVNLRTAWTNAVERLEKNDPRVSHFVFNHFTKLHPRVADDQIMAHELSAWLKTQSFLKK